MNKTILTDLDGFTPVPDVLVQRYGALTALVYGVVWRYCQMKDKVCRARLERIACDLDISRRSVIRHIRILVLDGYLEDTTPDLRNRPHLYADTGKVSLESRLQVVERDVPESRTSVPESHSAVPESHTAVTESHTAVTESHTAVPESHTTVTESHSHGDTESLEDSKKIPVKKPAKSTAPANGEIFKIYEQEIGPLTPMICQDIQDHLDDPGTPAEYVADAIREAARQNKRRWAYVRAILQRWAVEGKQAREKPPPGRAVKPPDRPEYQPYVEPQEGQYVARYRPDDRPPEAQHAGQ